MTAPANDNFANAVLVNPGGSTFGPFVIDDATSESGENTYVRQSVWYKFYAGEATTVHVSTWGSIAGDEDSGDLFPGVGSFGYLDTKLAAYYKSDGTPATAFGQLTGAGNNDDHPDTGEPHTGDGYYWSYLSFTTVANRWYYVQAGTFGLGYTGTLRVEFDTVPRLPFPAQDLGECPIQVLYRSVSAGNTGTQPHAGDPGQFDDMTIDWYEPVHEAGDLLVFVGISSKLGLSVPAGYTAMSSDDWDDAPITPPIHGANSTTIGPAWNQEVQQFIGYRIATSSGGSNSIPAGSYTDFSYNDNGLAYYSNSMASRVYRFSLEQMGGEYPAVGDLWPDPPIKVGPITWEKYDLELGPSGGAFGAFYPSVDTPGPNVVTVSDVVADHPGNHIWMTIVGIHGPVLADSGVSYPTTARNNSMALNPGEQSIGGMNAGVGASSGTGLNDHRANVYLSNTNYFVPFSPYGTPDEPTLLRAGENGFVDETSSPDAQVTGHVGTDWADGFVGTAGTDFYIWDLMGGVAMQQVVIQGPETTRPPNDNLESAYAIDQCPVTIVECVFGQSSEPGETYDGLGDADLNNSVWFKYTPTNDEVDVPIRTGLAVNQDLGFGFFDYFTEYDTILVVYDSSMTVIASDDDSDTGDLSMVTIDVTGGSDYYIQVAGYGGDEGRLMLTIGSEGACGLLDYWGVLAGAM